MGFPISGVYLLHMQHMGQEIQAHDTTFDSERYTGLECYQGQAWNIHQDLGTD